MVIHCHNERLFSAEYLKPVAEEERRIAAMEQAKLDELFRLKKEAEAGENDHTFIFITLEFSGYILLLKFIRLQNGSVWNNWTCDG